MKLSSAVMFVASMMATTAMSQEIQRINPPGMTQPTGYHHVIRVENVLFVAGQVALDAEGNIVGKGDMKAQVQKVLENMRTVLASQGADFSNVVKVNIFTTDIAAFREAGEIRAKFFEGHPPASTLVQISSLARPDFLVEIEAIAILPRDEE